MIFFRKNLKSPPLGHEMSKWEYFWRPCLQKGFRVSLSRLVLSNLFSLLISLICFFSIPSFASAAAIVGKTPTNTLTNGLVGWWTLDGKDTDWSKNQTYDRSDNGNTGTMTSMSTTSSPVAGKVGQGLKFDGTDDYISVNDNSSLDGMANLTISTWFYARNAGQGNSGRIIEKNSGADYAIKYGGSNTYWGVVNNGIAATAAITNVFNKWHHIVMVYDGANITMYVDGLISGTPSALTGNVNNSSSIVAIGNASSGFNRTHDGRLDDVRIYNRALSASEVLQLYKSSATAYAAKTPTNTLTNGLVGWWTFDGRDTNWSSNTTSDRSGSGNTGTMTSMSTTSSPVAGKVGQGFKFDGVNDYLDVGRNTSFDNMASSGSYTFSAWANNSSASQNQHLFGNRNGSSGVAFGVRLAGSTNCRFSLFGVADYDSVGCNPLDNKWHYWTLTWTIGSSVSIYRDGVLLETISIGTGSASTQNMYLGAFNSTGSVGNPLLGRMDDVRIYNRALSASEVLQLYKSSATTYASKTPTNTLTNGLVGYWTFDGKDMPNGQVNDVSGNGFNGSMVGMTTSTAYSIGKIGQGLSFLGNNVVVPRNSTFNSTVDGDHSFCLWEKSRSTNTVETLFSLNDAGTGYKLVYLNHTSVGRLIYYDGSASLDSDALGSNTSNLNNGKWRHLCFTLGGTTQSIYVDGVLDNSRTRVASTHVDTDLSIGGASIGQTVQIDDFRIYNRALSASEVKQLYNLGR